MNKTKVVRKRFKLNNDFRLVIPINIPQKLPPRDENLPTKLFVVEEGNKHKVITKEVKDDVDLLVDIHNCLVNTLITNSAHTTK